ncbi:MAG: hypothetical protein MUC53_12170 [Candidatus Contendobacter sp.]|jgi:hypothetical protein|nr:hypothetical protein [Candidatus Contendobacter sp.]
MKTVGVEIERQQVAISWVSVPNHWDHDRITREVILRIESIREAADSHKNPLKWGRVYGPEYRLSAVIGAYAEFEPDYCFPDEAPPKNPNQTALEI